MARIKRFWCDESASAEASSSVIMIAAVGVLLAAGLLAYYGAMGGVFQQATTSLTSAKSQWNATFK